MRRTLMSEFAKNPMPDRRSAARKDDPRRRADNNAVSVFSGLGKHGLAQPSVQSACKAGALPTELRPRRSRFYDVQSIRPFADLCPGGSVIA